LRPSVRAEARRVRFVGLGSDLWVRQKGLSLKTFAVEPFALPCNHWSSCSLCRELKAPILQRLPVHSAQDVTKELQRPRHMTPSLAYPHALPPPLPSHVYRCRVEQCFSISFFLCLLLSRQTLSKQVVTSFISSPLFFLLHAVYTERSEELR